MDRTEGRSSGGFAAVCAALVFVGSGVAGCGDALGPVAKVDGLAYSASARVPAPPPGSGEPRIEATVDVRNESPFRIQRTFDGGCFIRRLQLFDATGDDRRLAWDSARWPGWACTDDLAILDLRPGEAASPHNWRAGVRLAELRDSLPAGRYEVVIRIQAGERQLRAGLIEID